MDEASNKKVQQALQEYKSASSARVLDKDDLLCWEMTESELFWSNLGSNLRILLQYD